MELRHLRYFVAVAEELNFTHAATRLRVAQPALSSQIKDLEDELQTSLFERGRRGVQLTAGGKAFYHRARSILAQAAQAANEARTAAGLGAGTLVLGFPSGLHLAHLSPVIEAFRSEHSKVELDYFHGLPAQQLKALREGRVDVAFVSLPAPLEGLSYRLIWRVPFQVVLPRKHRLARNASFELTELRGEDFVFSSRESRPEFYDEFMRQCANSGFRPRVVKEVGGYPTNILALISVGVGLSVLPCFKGIERIGGLVWRPLTKPRLFWDFALAWKPAVSALVEQFVDTAEALSVLPNEPDRAEF